MKIYFIKLMGVVVLRKIRVSLLYCMRKYKSRNVVIEVLL